MSHWMTSEQRYAWQIALELKLRQLNSTAFQDFFADVMTRAHRDNYVKTRPYGSLGDKGCDGYLASVGRVFACYGKVDDSSPSVATILSKMDDDYAKACAFLTTRMKEWHFVHNMLDGTPSDATVGKLEEMRGAYPIHAFGLFGRASFEDTVFDMREADIVALIGMGVTAEDTRNMKLQVVADLVEGIMAAVDELPFDLSPEPKEVPREKLAFNKLPAHWCHVIRSQMTNAELVKEYLGRHPDVERGEKVAAAFKARYRLLREQRLSPEDIMGNLYEGIVGIGTVTNDRVVAAQAILTFLFVSCDIFEDKPVEMAA